MGLVSQISSAFGISRKPVEILLIGLDNSGKSTVLNQMKPSEMQSTNVMPTIGYTNDKFTYKNTNFSVYDMSGQGKYRNLWEAYYNKVSGLVFVVDSSDRLRMAVARDELWMMLDNKELNARKSPLVVLANKMNDKGAMSCIEVNQCLGLDLIRSRAWHIFATCAMTGQGLDDAFQWLIENIKTFLESHK